jgi:hypothetical protein
MAARTKPDWKVLDRLLPVLEQEGWSPAQMADDWGMSLATLEGHLTQEDAMQRSAEEYAAIIAEFDQRRASGESVKAIEADFKSRGIPRTFQNHRTQLNRAHPSTPVERQVTPEAHPSVLDEPELWAVHPGTPEHLSTPERTETPDEQYTQEHQTTPEHSGVPQHTDLDEVHSGTPEAHQKVSPTYSGVPEEYSGVPARQDQLIGMPLVHPGTPTDEDWQLWHTIKARWLEVEKMLADRQVVLSTPLGTPGHTQKKTYVFDVRHITLIDRYAQDHRLDLKDVIYAAFQEFFERRGYVEERG